MKSLLSALACLLISFCLHAQQYRLKGFTAGVPASPTVIGIANFSFEVANKKNHSTYQFTINIASGTFTTDIPTPSRKWITIEKINSFKSRNSITNLFYTIFIEAGKRTGIGGYYNGSMDNILKNEKAFEINPGIGVVASLPINKRWKFEITGGPKLIFASHFDDYYNSIAQQPYIKKYADVKAGFRLMICFSYKLSKQDE